MIREVLRQEMMGKLSEILNRRDLIDLEDDNFYHLSLAFYQFLLKFEPNCKEYISRIGETYHLMSDLKKSAQYYKKVLENEPPQALSHKEKELVIKFAPIFHVLESEPFELMDVVAIHHPKRPIIAYHIFWEDDYDFPDDFEPCDHEEIWVEYNPAIEEVVGISTWFHGFVHRTDQAVKLAARKQGRADVFVQWGKHGSMLSGWKEAVDPITGISIMEIMQRDYMALLKGGRLPDHPIKKLWPRKYEGSFEEFINFSKQIDSREILNRKQMMIKSQYSSAVIQQYFLPYNFHPKYDWPLY